MVKTLARIAAILVSIWMAIQPLIAASPDEVSELEVLKLDALRSKCTLEKRWVGAAFDLPWGTWLRCGDGEPVLVTQPRNLLGKVDIDSAEEALQFVRFFSSPHNHEMFNLNGMLEITPTADYWGQSVVEATSLGDRFHPPEVTATTRSGFCFSASGKLDPCEMQEFTIRRLAAFYDNNIYEVVETVTEDGFYTVVSKDLVVDDLSQYGLLHLPPY